MPNQKQAIGAFILAVMAMFVSAVSIAAGQGKDAEDVVNNAKSAFENFAADPNMGWFRAHVKKAQAVLIVPQLVKGGFIFGGSGGTGALLAKDPETGTWSYPAFYTMGSVTWGLQIGAEVAEVILLVMTENGLDSFLSTKFQLGGDVSVAAGPVGVGGQAATVDILQFARTKGVFAGLTLEGAVIGIRNKLNTAYYGKVVRPKDILIRRAVSNNQAQPLINSVTRVGGG